MVIVRNIFPDHTVTFGFKDGEAWTPYTWTPYIYGHRVGIDIVEKWN